MKHIVKKNQMIITVLAIMIAVAGYLNFAGSKVTNEDIVVETDANAEGKISAAEVADISDEDMYASSTTDDGVVIIDEAAVTSDDGLTDIASLDSEADVGMEVAEGETAGIDTDGTQLADASADISNGEAIESTTPGEAVFTSSISGVGLSANAKLMKEQTRAKNKETLLEVINSGNLGDEQKQSAIAGMISMTDIAERETAAEILLEAKGFSDVLVSITDKSVDVMVGSVELTDAKRAQIEDVVKRKTGIGAESIIITPIAPK